MTGMVPHFQEDNRINQSGLVQSETFSRCLDHLVLTCVDIVFFHQKKLLVGKRKTYPRKDWWVIGGRMYAGESPLEAVVRKTYQETHLQLDHSRFVFTNVYSTCFATRQQEPRDHGLHSVNLTYTLKLMDEEFERLSLTSSEYDEWVWLSLNELQQQVNMNDPLDQALVAIAQDAYATLFSSRE